MSNQDYMRIVWGRRKLFKGSPAPVVPFYNWRYYYTLKDIIWKSNTDSRSVKVPSGFVTDLASIPDLFSIVLPRAAKYTYPAIVHDYLYWVQPNDDREGADDIFRTAMSELDVEWAHITAIYNALRMFGGSAWEANRRARESGEKRILKAFPEDVTISWEVWKSRPDVFA